VKLTAQVKLCPTAEQAEALRKTMETANEAANFVSERAWQTRTFHRFALSSVCYHDVRATFGLAAQMTTQIINVVAGGYRAKREGRHTYRLTSAITYDSRVLSWKEGEVSIWTLDGRQRIPFLCGPRQEAMLARRCSQAKLVTRRGEWFLLIPCEVEVRDRIATSKALGVDLGVVNIAVDSDGEIHSASHLLNVRHRNRRLRGKLQRLGTRSAKRKIKRLSGREARFARDTNHVISKRIVAKAEGTARAIALEDLKGITKRQTVRQSQRATLHSWSFHQLREFIAYKAELAGIPVVVVDPRNTSRTCPECGLIDKKNRRSQESFVCVSCGFAGHADTVAAGVIAGRAVADPPIVAALSG
jgi:IS605 OrfB family transposase